MPAVTARMRASSSGVKGSVGVAVAHLRTDRQHFLDRALADQLMVVCPLATTTDMRRR